MPKFPINPSTLEGDDLARWYVRNPEDLAAERYAAEGERYLRYFDTQSDAGNGAFSRAVDDAQDELWIADVRGGYGKVGKLGDDFLSTLEPERNKEYPKYLPENASSNESGQLIDVGNPENARLKREYIKKYGYWPKTPGGKDYEVAHIRAIPAPGFDPLVEGRAA